MDCFIDNEYIAQTAPIEKASAFIPDWWRTLPSRYTAHNAPLQTPEPTIKTCFGFTQLFANSIGIPLWTELCIQTYDDSSMRWIFSDLKTHAMSHPSEQTGGLLERTGYHHLKISPPWRFKCSHDIKFLLSPPTYNMIGMGLDNITILPGVLEFKTLNQCNINMLIKKQPSSHMTIPAGTMMLNITPLSEKKVVIKRHVISTTERDEMDIRRLSFINSYKTTKRAINKFSKCPYSKK